MTLSALLQTLIPSENPSRLYFAKGHDLSDIPHPPNFSGWSDIPEHVWETPESPPLCEKANYPTIFDEQMLSQDIDMRCSDVDHRNLISLTETASTTWPGDDTDYRTKNSKNNTNIPSIQNQDNVENVDMEMSDDDDKLEHLNAMQSPAGRSRDDLNVPIQNPHNNNNYNFNNRSNEEPFFNINKDENNVKPPIPHESVPPLSYNNSTSSYPPVYSNNPPYTINNTSFNNNSTYAMSASSSTNTTTTNIPPFKTCYSEIYVTPPPPPTAKVEGNISDFNLDKFPSPPNLQPPLPPPLPPPPPPPPPHHPPQMWSQSFTTPPPPPQFDTSQNYSQQSLFFSSPPPPVPPSPQIPITHRPYRANFRPFQRVSARFQRW